MKKYEGILICSDYDGTFSFRTIPERNVTAIGHFVEEGGLFTFCSGRRGAATDGHLPVPANAPMIGLCGGEIYDFASHRAVERYPLTGDVPALLRDAVRLTCGEKVELNYADEQVFVTPDEIPDSLPSPIYKAVIYNGKGENAVTEETERIFSGRCGCFANGPGSLELVAAGHDKGAGALRVKEITGAHTLIGVGDYQADIPLLRAADIGIATGNALPEVKAAADKVVCDVLDGAIAEIIESL